MTECRRNFTKEQIIAGLKAGRTLVLDRLDAPELQDLIDLQREGLVTSRVVEYDEQSTAIKWKWVSRADGETTSPAKDRA